MAFTYKNLKERGSSISNELFEKQVCGLKQVGW